MPSYTQDDKPLAVKVDGLGKDDLLLESLSGMEELSRLFRFDLEMLSVAEKIDPEKVVGKKVTFRVNRHDGEPRWFTGYVSRFGWLGRDERLTRWRAEVVPGLWFLTRTSDCKIWQEKKIPKIVSEVLEDHSSQVKVTESLQGSYVKWENCVQYRETDFNFVSRLLEQEGVAYFFKHDENSLEMVLADASSAFTDAAEAKLEPADAAASGSTPGLLQSWSRDWTFKTGKFAQRDYEFKTPGNDLSTEAKGKTKYDGASALEIYDYPGEYEKKADGDADTKLRIEAEEASAQVIQGSSGYRTLSPGFTVNDAAGEKYLLTAVNHSASIRGAYQADEQFTFSYANSFSCIPADVPFRPGRTTPKPLVSGVQTAVVVGKEGEEIDCDEFGRVKVQFHWDRLGEKNEKSSCWMRVAQSMAGPGWGGQFLPRIGQEVVVTFLEGDPDRPLVTGVVYNGQNKPPYSLPDNKTQSGFKSRSTKDASDNNFNELRFEDKKGAEEVYFHAEKDFTRVVENDDSLEVGFSKKDSGDRTVKVFNDQTEEIGCSEAKSGSRSLTVWKDDSTTVKTGNQSVTIEKGNQTTQVDTGNVEVALKMGNQTFKLDTGGHTTEAMQKIELKVGGNSITIDQAGITIKGIMVSVQGSATAEVKSAMTTVKGDGMLTMKGGVAMIN